MTFVIVTGGIDLSVGSVMAFTGIWLAKLLEAGTPLAIAMPAIMVGGALVGLLIGILVQYFEVQPFIASLAGLFLARGLAFVVSLSSIKGRDGGGVVTAIDANAARRLVHHADRHPGAIGGIGRSVCDAVHPLRADDLRDRRQSSGVIDGSQGGTSHRVRLRDIGRVRRPGRTGPDRVFRRRLSPQWDRHRAGRDRRRRHRWEPC